MWWVSSQRQVCESVEGTAREFGSAASAGRKGRSVDRERGSRHDAYGTGLGEEDEPARPSGFSRNLENELEKCQGNSSLRYLHVAKKKPHVHACSCRHMCPSSCPTAAIAIRPAPQPHAPRPAGSCEHSGGCACGHLQPGMGAGAGPCPMPAAAAALASGHGIAHRAPSGGEP